MPDVPPVTMKTLPDRSGSEPGVQVILGDDCREVEDQKFK
jgi:hypothetical protein